jgi:hypothetical protein
MQTAQRVVLVPSNSLRRPRMLTTLCMIVRVRTPLESVQSTQWAVLPSLAQLHLDGNVCILVLTFNDKIKAEVR